MNQLNSENNRLRFQTLENLPITYEPDEFEKYPVEVHDFKTKTPIVLKIKKRD